MAEGEKILIVAPTEVERAGLEALLRADPSLAVAVTAPGEEVAERVERERPDVVLVALERDDAALLALLDDEGAGPPVVALADDPDAGWVAGAIRAGLRGVLPRSASAAAIVAAVRAAAAGLVVLDPDAAAGAARPAPPARADGDRPAQALTPREAEVLRMLADGLGNKEIAWRLQISEHTVKFHIASIFTKLDASSRTEAVTIGIRQGLIVI